MPSTFPQPSAALSNRAQNNCRTCGFQNLEVDVRCQKCGRRLHPLDASQASAPIQQEARQSEIRSIPTAKRPALPEHVRSEIHSRVEKFKARRRTQTLPLPFAEPVLAAEEKVFPFPTLEEEPAGKVARPRTSSREASVVQIADIPAPSAVSTNIPVEPCSEVLDLPARGSWPTQQKAAEESFISQSPVDLSMQVPLFEAPSDHARPQWHMFQIATLGKRLQGIGHDFGRLSMGVLLFAAPFYWIAGAPQLTVKLLGGFVGAALLITLLYGFLFLGVFGETPGMTAAGLRVVSFSGQPATFQQRLLRVLGALVSSGSLLCGYFWAFVDEERLYWHDHISKTVLTDTPE